MMSVAYPMSRDERQAVAAYLGVPGVERGPRPEAYCADRSVRIRARPRSQWNGWSPAADNSRFQSGGGLRAGDVPRLKVKWAFGFDGDVTAFAQPSVLDGHVFVGSAAGLVHALDRDRGCIRWVFQADAPVRAAIVAAPVGQRNALLFGDQVGSFYALDALTGRLLWKKKVEEHDAARLTAAPIVHNGVVFVPVASWEETRAIGPDYPCCTFRGSVVALRVRDGSLVWKSYVVRETPKQTGRTRVGTERWGPSGAGIWSTPALDPRRGVMYVTTGDNYSSPTTDTSDAVLALDLASGRIVWSRQTTPGDAYNSSCNDKGANCPEEDGPDYDFGASAVMVRLPSGRDLLFAGQKSGVVYAIDPDRRGEIVWQTRVGKGGVIGGVQWGMASDGQKLYVAVSDAGRIRVADAGGSNPNRFTLDPKQGGGLSALSLGDGQIIWRAPPAVCGPTPGCSPAQSAAVTAIPGVIFSGALDGHLRAFDTETGRVVWDVDTVRDYETANGVKARGGSLDGPGAVVAGGMVFVNSGYARFGGIPGNVLLAFAPEK